MTFLRIVKAGVVLIILLILQLELFASIRFFGVMPEIMLGAAVVSGWHGGPTDGAIMGFKRFPCRFVSCFSNGFKRPVLCVNWIFGRNNF